MTYLWRKILSFTLSFILYFLALLSSSLPMDLYAQGEKKEEGADISMRDLILGDGNCGLKKIDEIGVAELSGLEFDTCEIFNNEKKKFECTERKTINFLDASGKVSRTLSCDTVLASEKKIISSLVEKLNSEVEGLEEEKDNSLLNFLVIKECKEETDPEMLKAGRCYTDKVDYVKRYAPLLSMMVVSLLGIVIPSHCIAPKFDDEDPKYYRSDMDAFAISASNYLNSEQLAYQEYLMYLNEIRNFSPYALEYFSNRSEYPEFIASETEKKVTESFTNANLCEKLTIGDQVKALIQAKMDYIAMIDLLDRKHDNYKLARESLYDAASVAHSIVEKLDADWGDCETQVERGYALCMGMMQLGLLLMMNEKTRGRGRDMVEEGLRGMRKTMWVEDVGSEYSAYMSSAGGVTPSNEVFNQTIRTATYNPTSDTWALAAEPSGPPSDENYLEFIKFASNDVHPCYGTLPACEVAARREMSSMTACNPDALTCKALNLSVGEMQNPNLTAPSGQTAFIDEEYRRLFIEEGVDLKAEFKKIAKYIVSSFSSDKMGEILNQAILDLKKNTIRIDNTIVAIANINILNNVNVFNSAYAQESSVSKSKYQTSVLEQAKALKNKLSAIKDKLTGQLTYPGEIKEVDSIIASLAGVSSDVALLGTHARLFEIQDSTLGKTNLSGRFSQNLFKAPEAANGSPLACNNIPVSEFKSCLKDSEVSKEIYRTSAVSSQTVSLCSLYDPVLNKFRCQSGKIATKNIFVTRNGFPVSSMREVSVPCLDLENGTISSVAAGGSIGDSIPAGIPSREQTYYGQEMSCITQAMNKKLENLSADASKAQGKSGVFEVLENMDAVSFDYAGKCGGKDVGMQLKDPFGLWDDAIFNLRGDDGRQPLMYLAAREGDKALASPRFRAILYESIAEEVVVIEGLLIEIRTAVLSNIENINKILKNTELKTERIADCEENLEKETLSKAVEPIQIKTMPVIKATEANREGGTTCTVGRRPDGSCPSLDETFQSIDATLKGTLTKPMAQSIGARIQGYVNIAKSFENGGLSGSIWMESRNIANASTAQSDLTSVKAFRNKQDSARGQRQADYDSLVASSRAKSGAILNPSKQGTSGLGVARTGSAQTYNPSAQGSTFKLPSTPKVKKPVSVVESKTPSSVLSSPLVAKTDDVDSKYYNYERYGAKDKDQIFSEKVLGVASGPSIFEIISNRYMKTGLERLGRLSR